MGLSRTLAVIFSWFDHLDLQVFTHSGRRLHEFQQPHPAGIILQHGRVQPGKCNLVILMLSKKLASARNKSAAESGRLPLHAYSGKVNVYYPNMSLSHTGQRNGINKIL